MSVLEKLNEEIKNAMKSKNEVRLNVIRMLKNKILQVNARGEMSEEEAGKLFKNYAKQLKETIQIARENSKEEAALEAEAELVIVNEFLPAALSPEKIAEVVKSVIAEQGKERSKFGLIMKESMTRLQGQADGAVVKELVNKLLS